MTPQPDGSFDFRLGPEEAMTLRAALRRYIAHFQAHSAADGGETHPPEQVEEVRLAAGRLIWRLEELTAGESRIVHSNEAVPPSSH